MRLCLFFCSMQWRKNQKRKKNEQKTCKIAHKSSNKTTTPYPSSFNIPNFLKTLEASITRNLPSPPEIKGITIYCRIDAIIDTITSAIIDSAKVNRLPGPHFNEKFKKTPWCSKGLWSLRHRMLRAL